MRISNDKLIADLDAKLTMNSAKQSKEINSLKESFTATYLLFMRLLIYDARAFIKTKLGRQPLVRADNTAVLWDDYLNALTPADLLTIRMDRDLIQFMRNEFPGCNATAHSSDKTLVAATLLSMPNSISKTKWEALFSIVYEGQTPEDVI
jgi:hypothetical protein